jgi:hypothetical protein
MRKYFFTLASLGALLFGSAFALPAEDLPETLYDESQGVACEHTPLFLTQLPRDSVQRAQPTQKSASPLLSGSQASRGEIRLEKKELSKQSDCVTPTTHAISLRC